MSGTAGQEYSKSPVELVHIGDTHLRAGSRYDDKLQALAQILAENQNRPVGLWLWPGDIFHTRSTPTERNDFVGFLQQMAAVAPVVLVAGNHDAPGDLEIYRHLSAAYRIYVYTQPDYEAIPLPSGHVVHLIALPYLTKADLQGDTMESTVSHLLESLTALRDARLHNNNSPMEIPVVAGHMTVAGAMSSTGQPQIGSELEVTELLLDLTGSYLYKGFNHIHKAQTIGAITYAGSICRMDFGENEAKSYVRIHYDGTMATDHRPYFTVQRCALDVPQQWLLNGVWDEDGREMAWDHGDITRPALMDADVRIRYRFPEAAAKEAQDSAAHLRTLCESMGARSVRLEPVIERTHALRAPEILEATQLVDKVRKWCELRKEPWTQAVEDATNAVQNPLPDDAWYAKLQAEIDAVNHED